MLLRRKLEAENWGVEVEFDLDWVTPTFPDVTVNAGDNGESADIGFGDFEKVGCVGNSSRV